MLRAHLLPFCLMPGNGPVTSGKWWGFQDAKVHPMAEESQGCRQFVSPVYHLHMLPGHSMGEQGGGWEDPRSSSHLMLVDRGWLSFQSCSNSIWKEKVCNTGKACLSVSVCLPACLPTYQCSSVIQRGLSVLPYPSTTTATSRLLVWASESPPYLGYIGLAKLGSDYEFNYFISPDQQINLSIKSRPSLLYLSTSQDCLASPQSKEVHSLPEPGGNGRSFNQGEAVCINVGQ